MFIIVGMSSILSYFLEVILFLFEDNFFHFLSSHFGNYSFWLFSRRTIAL